MGPAEGSGWVADVAELAGLAISGRILLAWLPPGRPGSHQGREIVATWAASHLIGLAAASIGGGMAEHVGLADGTARIIAWNFLAVLLVARLMTLPGALVPRHEPTPVRWSWASRIAVLATVAAVAFGPAALGWPRADAVTIANAIATLAFVAYGLGVARAPAWVQALGCSALAWFLVVVVNARTPVVVPSALGSAAAAAGAIGWLRRGDARGLALAAVAIGHLASDREWGSTMAAAFALWIVIGTPRPARLRAAAWCIGGCALGLTAPWGFSDASFETILADPAPRAGMLLLLLITTGIVIGWIADFRRKPAAWNPSGAARGHEGRTFLWTIVTGFVLTFAAWRWAPELGVMAPIVAAWVLFAFVGALGLTRFVVERPEAP